MKVLVVCYSLYGHVYRMAQEVEAGAGEVQGTETALKRVPETLSPEVIESMGATEFQRTFSQVPVCQPDELADYDAIVFGTPTRFGNMCGQMRQFLDATGGLWANGALIGKLGSVFTSTATQHGGQESTLLSFHTSLLHHGMLVVGLPYAFDGQMNNEEIIGGTPYGATTVAGTQGESSPGKIDLAGARFQGRHVAELAARMAGRQP